MSLWWILLVAIVILYFGYRFYALVSLYRIKQRLLELAGTHRHDHEAIHVLVNPVGGSKQVCAVLVSFLLFCLDHLLVYLILGIENICTGCTSCFETCRVFSYFYRDCSRKSCKNSNEGNESRIM